MTASIVADARLHEALHEVTLRAGASIIPIQADPAHARLFTPLGAWFVLYDHHDHGDDDEDRGDGQDDGGFVEHATEIRKWGRMSQETEKELLHHIAVMYEILEECFVYSHIDSDGNKGVEWIMQWMIRVLPLIPADAWSDAGPWLDIPELLARYKRSGTFQKRSEPLDWDVWAQEEVARIQKYAEERKADTPPEKSAFNKSAFLPHMHRSENDFRPPVQYELSPKDYLVLMGED